MSSTQVSSGTVDLDNGEGHSAEEPKSIGLNAADMLGKQVISLLRYLDGEMAKYAKPAIAESYVELVCDMTQAKMASYTEIAARVISLTS